VKFCQLRKQHHRCTCSYSRACHQCFWVLADKCFIRSSCIFIRPGQQDLAPITFLLRQPWANRCRWPSLEHGSSRCTPVSLSYFHSTICKNMTRKEIWPRKEEYGCRSWCKRLERQCWCVCSSIQRSSIPKLILHFTLSLLRTNTCLFLVSLKVYVQVFTIPLIFSLIFIFLGKEIKRRNNYCYLLLSLFHLYYCSLYGILKFHHS
jgi:hypothetical protein